MNLKVMLVGAIFLVPHFMPYFYEEADISVQDKVKKIGSEAKEIAPTGRVVESIEKTENFVVGWIQALKQFSFAVGILLVAVGVFV